CTARHSGSGEQGAGCRHSRDYKPFPHQGGRMTVADQNVRAPAAQHRSSRLKGIKRSCDARHAAKRKMLTVDEIKREPGENEIEGIGITKLGETGSPQRALREDFAIRCGLMC